MYIYMYIYIHTYIYGYTYMYKCLYISSKTRGHTAKDIISYDRIQGPEGTHPVGLNQKTQNPKPTRSPELLR